MIQERKKTKRRGKSASGNDDGGESLTVLGVGVTEVTAETRLAPGRVVVFADDSLVSFEVKQ